MIQEILEKAVTHRWAKRGMRGYGVYDKRGKQSIMVNVIDIFGNDTSQVFEKGGDHLGVSIW